MDRAKNIAANLTAIALIAIMLLWANTFYRQWSQFRKGEAALAARDYIAAIAGFESAIHLYTPGPSLVGRAAEQLWAIGERFEKSGDRQQALIAYRSLRSSFYAVRGLFTPGSEWIARCEQRIALLAEPPARPALPAP